MITLMRKTAQLVLRTALPELNRLAAWVETVAREAQLAADTVFAVQLCLEEAVANIMMYGGADADAAITVRIEPAERELVAVIEDGARPFDPTALPPRIAPQSLEEARTGQLGVHLIRNYASQMQYEQREGRNRLTLRFTHAQAAPKPA
jgi:anti-sigma regulatory factor (Ser/Thr protein kinase)